MEATANGGTDAMAMIGMANSATTNNIGALLFAAGGVSAIGVDGRGATGTSVTYGARGAATGGVRAFGVSGSASGASQFNYGIHGTASGNNAWAGWFQGNVNVTGLDFIPGGVWQGSDEALKTDVQEVHDAIGIIGQLQPKTYTYLSDAHPNVGLPAGTHCGLMAQELLEVLPQLVQDISIPALLDTLGVELSPAETIMAINYTGLVPYLIAAFNEQQKRLDQLEGSLAACCAQDTDKSYQPGPMDGHGQVKQDPAMERLLRIDPNPFTDATTVRYTLERAGRVQLLVNSGDGKQLQVLHEGLASAGDHSYDWHTAHLAPGVYYVTLLLDGEPLVKRAVKVR
ncbi:MAG: tail fiber domain-containing protein [Flavobacteriales bacterium]|nr:tail fiber domain-containing protein [Flavobacteriales bacterium]